LSSQSKLSQLKDTIREKAVAWGADLVGFANVERFSGYHAENRPPAGTKTVIVLAIWMEDPILDLWLHLPSKICRNRPSRAFEDEILRGISLHLSLLIEREGFWADPSPYEPGLYLKDAAVLAGLGVIGKNNLLITDKYGPRVRLRAVNTSAALEPDIIISDRNYCSTCKECVNSCPAKAFNTGKYHMEDCLGYCQANLEKISEHSVLWCMKCSTVCPIGKNKK
jgi:epoxyqueuosine reductase